MSKNGTNAQSSEGGVCGCFSAVPWTDDPCGGLDQTTFSPDILFEEGGTPNCARSAQRGSHRCAIAAPQSHLAAFFRIATRLIWALATDVRPSGRGFTQIHHALWRHARYAQAGYPLNGTDAASGNRAVTALLSYDVANGFFAYGGLRLLQSDGDIYVSLNAGAPNVFSYRFTGDSDTGVGYVWGWPIAAPKPPRASP